MLCETLWVNRKLKFSVPSAGLSMPSIFCSTQGPTMTVWVVLEVPDCHGQPNLTFGRCTLIPIRCSAADSAVSTSQAAARRKTATITARMTVHRTQRGIRRMLNRVRGPGGRHAGPIHSALHRIRLGGDGGSPSRGRTARGQRPEHQDQETDH